MLVENVMGKCSRYLVGTESSFYPLNLSALCTRSFHKLYEEICNRIRCLNLLEHQLMIMNAAVEWTE